MSYLCITVRYLRGYCHARGEGGAPEWPPAPLRLFQALVAAAAARLRERLRLHSAVPALQWLEKRGPPQVVAPVATWAETKYRLYVPDNIGDKVAASWSRGGTATLADYRTEKDVWPARLDGDSVHYLFPLPEADGEFGLHRDTLTAAARHITHLGWGIDMVVADAAVIGEDEAAVLAGERWLPVQDRAANRLRVPVEGTLDELIRRHEAFLNRLAVDARGKASFHPVPPLSAFRMVGYRRASDPPRRRCEAFRLRHPEEDRAAVFDALHANRVAAMLRNATARLAQEQGWPAERIDRYVHGHRGDREPASPRFSYLPLPSLERRGDHGVVAGAIRRVLVAELCEAAESLLPLVRRLLPGQFLIDETSQGRKALLTPLGAGDWVLQQYTEPAETWATVTPVVLPGSDEGRFAKAEKLFFKALGHAGFSREALAELAFRDVSFWPGGELARKFLRPDYLTGRYAKEKRPWSVYHMRVRWKQPIAGPLALGAGRHCGLGIFARAP